MALFRLRNADIVDERKVRTSGGSIGFKVMCDCGGALTCMLCFGEHQNYYVLSRLSIPNLTGKK